jgi:hypothetical protein
MKYNVVIQDVEKVFGNAHEDVNQNIVYGVGINVLVIGELLGIL